MSAFILAILTPPPLNKTRSLELLDRILAYAAFEQPIRLVLTPQGTQLFTSSPLAPQWRVLPDYGIQTLYRLPPYEDLITGFQTAHITHPELHNWLNQAQEVMTL